MGWVADVLGYSEEPGARHAWKPQFADSIKGFQPVNLIYQVLGAGRFGGLACL